MGTYDVYQCTLFEMISNFDENVAFTQSMNESVGHGVEAYQIGYHENS